MARFEHTGVESVHVLLLTSATVLPIADPGHAGYMSRTETVDERHDQSVQVFWAQEIPRARLRRVEDPPSVHTDAASRPLRVRCAIKSEYKDQGGGYNGRQRAIWCPTPVTLAHIKQNKELPREQWRAVGCTCMDMVMRGNSDAIHGCK